MSDKKKHIDKDEEFNKLVRQKLENHQLPVPDDIWAALEQKLAGKPHKSHPAAWYWLACGVAAAMALLLILHPVQHIPQSTPNVSSVYEKSANGEPEPAATVEEPASDSAVADYENNPQSTPAEPEKAAGLIPEKSNKKNLYADTQTDTYYPRSADENPIVAKKNNVSTDSDDSFSTTETASRPDEPEENREHAAKVQPSTNKVEKMEKLPDLNDYPIIPEPSRKPKKKQKILMAATFGTEGGMPSSSPMGSFHEMTKPTDRLLVSSDIAKKYAGILRANDYAEAQHYAPVSAGVTVEMPLTERLGVESGLVYTYLKSVYRDPGSVEKNGSLQLHYLGIPLNMRVKASKKPKWNLYVSAGGMVEKGLRSYYHQEVGDRLLTRQTDVKSNIDGLQWSLSGAVGLDYKLSKDFSLFIEPKLIYYLENNQPESARTEQPLNVGLNGGLRIEL